MGIEVLLNETPTLAESLATAFTTEAGNVVSAIGSVAPVAIPVVGAMAVVAIGYKVFKRFTRG